MTGWKSFQNEGIRKEIHPGKVLHTEECTQKDVPRKGAHSGSILYSGKAFHPEKSLYLEKACTQRRC